VKNKPTRFLLLQKMSSTQTTFAAPLAISINFFTSIKPY